MTTKQEPLIPCPFCGRTPYYMERESDVTKTKMFYAITCYCGGFVGNAHKHGETKEDAIKRWNTRAPTSAAGEDVREAVEEGDYVVATKWSDGDFGDPWCVGFYDRKDGDRHMVKDGEGNQIRIGGFRKVSKISHDLGSFLMKNSSELERMSAHPEIFNIWMIVDKQKTAATSNECQGLVDALERVITWLEVEVFDDDMNGDTCTQEERAEHISFIITEALAAHRNRGA